MATIEALEPVWSWVIAGLGGYPVAKLPAGEVEGSSSDDDIP
jgi:hypothetical protein